MLNVKIAVVAAIWSGRNLVCEEKHVDGVPHYEMFTVLFDNGKSLLTVDQIAAETIDLLNEAYRSNTKPSNHMLFECNHDDCRIKWIGQDADMVMVVNANIDPSEFKSNMRLIEVDPVDVFTNAIYMHSKTGQRSPTQIFISNYASMVQIAPSLTASDLGRTITA